MRVVSHKAIVEASQLGKLDDLTDTQEALDALVASNMVNLGIILPLGMVIYTAVQ